MNNLGFQEYVMKNNLHSTRLQVKLIENSYILKKNRVIDGERIQYIHMHDHGNLQIFRFKS